jgi:DNA-binding MarR family transcriptional regulator
MANGSQVYLEVLQRNRNGLKELLAKALNRNQTLILFFINGKNPTAMLKELSASYGIPLSTLKLNAKILGELGLIRCRRFYPAELTELGALVKIMLKGD